MGGGGGGRFIVCNLIEGVFTPGPLVCKISITGNCLSLEFNNPYTQLSQGSDLMTSCLASNNEAQNNNLLFFAGGDDPTKNQLFLLNPVRPVSSLLGSGLGFFSNLVLKRLQPTQAPQFFFHTEIASFESRMLYNKFRTANPFS